MVIFKVHTAGWDPSQGVCRWWRGQTMLGKSAAAGAVTLEMKPLAPEMGISLNLEGQMTVGSGTTHPVLLRRT